MPDEPTYAQQRDNLMEAWKVREDLLDAAVKDRCLAQERLMEQENRYTKAKTEEKIAWQALVKHRAEYE